MEANIPPTIAHCNASEPVAIGREAKPLAAYPFTDYGNAERLVAMYGDDVRFCTVWSKWLIWDGRRWRVDDTGEVYRMAKAVVRALYAEIPTLESDELRAALAAFARASERKRALDAMIALAATEGTVAVRADVFDSDPWLLTVANGTLDLRTGKLREHRRSDLITNLVPIVYDRRATCPLWLAFLDRILAGNQRLIAFLRRFVGYSLTGDVSEQVFLFLYGEGDNGKSTLVFMWQFLLGPYAMQAAPDLLLAKHGEAHPTEQADLHGARLAVCSEVDEKRRFAEAAVKRLTGGDRIKARRMREDFWEFDPTHKIVIAANHKPSVRGTDHAFWRRVRLVPFEVKIPKNERDKHLIEKLRAEAVGILAWAVRGCREWQAKGLAEPPEVSAATAAYRGKQDHIGRFLANCCRLEPNARTTADELRAAYETWCEENAENPLSPNDVGAALSSRELTRKRSTGGRWAWLGVALKRNVPRVARGGRTPNRSGRSGSPRIAR